MIIQKRIDATPGIKPLIASLPYAIAVEDSEPDPIYNPTIQLSVTSRGKGSTCRYEDSVQVWTDTKSDTKKDD